MNAYRDRKLRKREFRRLWITRISAGLSEYDMKYSRFIDALTKADIQIDRKILADLALNNSDAFKAVVEQAKDSAEAKPEAKSAAKEATKEAAPKPVAKAA